MVGIRLPEKGNSWVTCRGDAVVEGDMRCDSPGHCAKYGTYTLIEARLRKIVTFWLVQVNKSIVNK